MDFEFDQEMLKQNRQAPPKDDGEKPPKEEQPKKRARRASAEKHSANECAQKLYQLWLLTHRITNSKQKMLDEKDFMDEGAGLSRLSEKYPIIAYIIKLLDPLFVSIGIYNKFHGFVTEGMVKWKDHKNVINMKKTQKANGETVYEYKPGESSRTYPNPEGTTNFQ